MARRIIREGKLQSQSNAGGITRITVGGFKSIYPEQRIEIKPLTILAGANSSGKSSIMQPLLLLKQTLESTYDPGALLLNGPNVKFTQADQLLSRMIDKKTINDFYVGVQVGSEIGLTTYFIQGKNKGKGFEVGQTIHNVGNQQYRLYREMSPDEIKVVLTAILAPFQGIFTDAEKQRIFTPSDNAWVQLVQYRCFLTLDITPLGFVVSHQLMNDEIIVGDHIRQTLHLPGLRGNPERDYPATAAGPTFPGTFELYAASIIEHWQLDNDKQKLTRLFNDLARLALTNKVVARRKNATAIELLVNRLLHSNKEDMASIADVGIGVSQALPVVVALHTAEPGQLVYIEQPEIHLHPRAQSALAEVLADAAKEGKRLVVETHSNLLLRGIQTAVAEGKLPPELVKLHWFTQLEDGSTRIDSADLDEAGAFGNWPEDFHTVTLQSESRYIDAAEARLMGD
jgi:predicted ATPase